MDHLAVNRLIMLVPKTSPHHMYCIIWKNHTSMHLALFNLDCENAFPTLYPMIQLLGALHEGGAILLEHDPDRYLYDIREEDIRPRSRLARDQAYASIHHLVWDDPTRLFAVTTRQQAVREAAD